MTVIKIRLFVRYALPSFNVEEPVDWMDSVAIDINALYKQNKGKTDRHNCQLISIRPS